MVDEWADSLSRLEELVRLMPGESNTQIQRDIRAALQRIEALKAYIRRVACAIGSPKDEDRLDEVIPLVLASYRLRTEKAESEKSELQEKLDMEVFNLKWWKGNVG